jgi:hypothetical protein
MLEPPAKIGGSTACRCCGAPARRLGAGDGDEGHPAVVGAVLGEDPPADDLRRTYAILCNQVPTRQLLSGRFAVNSRREESYSRVNELA